MLEPTTSITDFLLSFENLLFAFTILLKNKKTSNSLWLLFFLFISLGAFFGGLFHGFEWAHTKTMWQFVTLFLVLGITFFPCALSTFIWNLPQLFLWSSIIALSCVISFVLFESHSFLHIIIYEVLMLLVGAALSIILIKKQKPAAQYLLLGIMLSFLAACIQQSDLKLLIFNNNDLFHLTQMIGQALFFMAVRY